MTVKSLGLLSVIVSIAMAANTDLSSPADFERAIDGSLNSFYEYPMVANTEIKGGTVSVEFEGAFDWEEVVFATSAAGYFVDDIPGFERLDVLFPEQGLDLAITAVLIRIGMVSVLPRDGEEGYSQFLWECYRLEAGDMAILTAYSEAHQQ